MCQAKILIMRGEEAEMFMEDVVSLKVDGNAIWVRQFFEEPVLLRGSVFEIDFLDHTVKVRPHKGET
jgi:predicted RNA-binding protein